MILILANGATRCYRVAPLETDDSQLDFWRDAMVIAVPYWKLKTEKIPLGAMQFLLCYFMTLHGYAAVYPMFSVWFREYFLGTFGGLGATGLSVSLLIPVLPTPLEDLLALGLYSVGRKSMASKGHGNGWHKKGKKGPDNLHAGQYTTPPPPPVTTTLQPATTNVCPPPSLGSSSSSVPSTSSTPSLSGLRIGGPTTSTSAFIDSATTLQVVFKFKEALQIKEHLYEARKNLKNPGWLTDDVCVKFLEKWDTPEYKAGRDQAKTNRASEKGGSLHTGGSMSFATHRRRPGKWEVFSVICLSQTKNYQKNVIFFSSISTSGMRLPILVYTNCMTAGFFPMPRIRELLAIEVSTSVCLFTIFPDSTTPLECDGKQFHANLGFQKSIEDWRQTQSTSEDGTMVQPSPANMTNMWTTMELVKKYMPQVFHDEEESEPGDD
ncbi:hypothetical protein FXO37_29863 [Capsicum annuum]|nr:hypothetical protein FXO37_29863 [Capsicum annuum]